MYHASSDAGIHWLQTPTSGTPARVLGIDGALLGIRDSTIWISNDLGASFREFGTGFFDSSVVPLSIVFSDHYALAGTYSNSVWRRPLSQLVVPISTNASSSVAIENNPNPFVTATTITYTLPNSAFVSIELFDAVGREVRPVVNAFETAGKHSEPLDLENDPDGTYFCRITVAGQTTTHAIVKSGPN